VLTRRPETIETLGAATVLCSDKTGTLTVNRMSIVELFADGEIFWASRAAGHQIPEKFLMLIENGILASEEHPFDPMERAFHDLGQRCLIATRLHRDWNLVHEYALTPQLFTVTHIWKSPEQA
jgi:Ca2+-transporting ATPase